MKSGAAGDGGIAHSTAPSVVVFLHMPYAGLAVVLVSPRVPENVGAAARAASNYGVADLRVVSPRCDPRGEVAARVAVCAPAFASMTVHETLAGALDGALAVGLSRRAGSARRAYASPRALLDDASGRYTLPRPPGAPTLALVFGREESGLAATELALCAACVALPDVDAGFGSLNLATAVAVTLALLAGAAGGGGGGVSAGASHTPAAPDPPAPAATVDATVSRIATLCDALGLGGAETVGGGGAHGRKKRVPAHARAILARAGATADELGAVHAVLRAVEGRLGQEV